MKRDLREEAIVMIDQSISSGLIKPSNRSVMINHAASCLDGFYTVKSVMDEFRNNLIKQFDLHAKDGTLERLKKTDAPYFRKLWLAKFGKPATDLNA